MEQWDLAPGEPISQDSNARGFSSQMLDCPSAPYNSEDPEYSDTPVECTPGLPKASPLEESETCEDNEVAALRHSISFQRHPIQSPPCADLQEIDTDGYRKLSSVVSELVGTSDDTIMESSTKGMNKGHNLFLCSEELSVPDNSYGSRVSEGCCPRILCDPKLLEEDTQEDMQIYNPDLSDIPLPGKPLSLVIQDETPSKTLLNTSQPVDKMPPANALSDSYSIPEDDIIRRWENRKRKALSETNNQSSHIETTSYNVTKKKPSQSIVLKMLEDLGMPEGADSQKEFAKRPTFDNKENSRMPIVSAGASLPISTPSSSDATQDVLCIDLIEDHVDVTISAQKPKRLRMSDLKSLWPQSTSVTNSCTEAVSGIVNQSTPEQHNSGGWVCPKSKKSGGKGRQRTMDSWIR